MDEHPRRGEILKSNVDTVEVVGPQPRRRRIGLLAPLLVLAIAAVLAGALFLFVSTPQQQQRAAPTPIAQQPTVAPRPLAPAARKPQAGAVAMPAVNGISCDALESTLFHIHIHLAIFLDGQEQQVPFGIGIAEPWQVADTRQGQFVEDGSCFYWLHTHTGDGVVHIESPVRRTFTLGDFFAVWQQPLSTTQVGPAQGPVIVYVNGTRTTIDPNQIPLTSRALIQLDVGQDVPPLPFEFAPND
jgi:hypothetical protein